MVLFSTAQQLASDLTTGRITSVQIIDQCIEQINKHDAYLNAVSVIHPDARSRAKELDDLRLAGKTLGPLHGIPILLKDVIDVKGMVTTGGTLFLQDYYPARNADIVDRFLAAGLIILGKTTLSEMAYCKSVGLPCGWSALHGQSQSAFVRGGLQQDDSPVGHTGPNGSSSGSCIAVSAGYAPLAIGTETFGSLTNPSHRAGLYTIKSTPGSISCQGILPVSLEYDVAGPVARCPRDVAALLSVMTGRDYDCKASWPRVGTLHPDTWWADPNMCKPSGADPEMRAGTLKAFDMLAEKTTVKPVELDTEIFGMDIYGENAIVAHITHVFEEAFDAYADRTLRSMIEYNRAHPQSGGQVLLEEAIKPRSEEVKARVKAKLDENGRIFIQAFDDYGVDVIIAAGDSTLYALASASKCPSAVLPVGQLEFNGRPYGLTMAARPGDEAVLLGIMQAWDDAFGVRLIPNFGK